MTNDLSRTERSELEELRKYKSKVTDRYRVQWARTSLMVEKAKKAGIVVTDEEVEQRLKIMKRKK